MGSLSRFWLAALAVLFLVCVLNIVAPPGAKTQGDLRARYGQLRRDMAEAEVLAIVGPPGEAIDTPYIDRTLVKPEEVDHTQGRPPKGELIRCHEDIQVAGGTGGSNGGVGPACLRTPTEFDSKPGTQYSLLVATREAR